MIAGVEQAIAIVDHRHCLEQLAVEGILRIVVEDRRGAADRLRPEARARPVGHRGVEGDTPHDRVRALDVLGVAPSHEGERACIGRVIRAADIEFLHGRIPQELVEPSSGLSTLRDAERVHILRVLEAVEWNKLEAAKVLDISRGTLYRKIEEYGLEPNASRRRREPVSA